MAATRFYIDGLNFYYGAVRGTQHRWLDFEKVCRTLVPDDHIDLIHYFTAQVKPRFPGDTAHERQHLLLRAIRANPLVRVTEGHFRVDEKWRDFAARPAAELVRPELQPGDTVEQMFADAALRRTDLPVTEARVLIPQEKGSDVNLASYLLRDAFRGEVAKAVVVTNDEDLEAPIRMAAAEGVLVGIVNPHMGHPERRVATSRRLLAAASFEIPFRREVLAKCHLPPHLFGENGKELHIPREWS